MVISVLRLHHDGRQIGVEGFPDFEALCDFVLFQASAIYPEWEVVGSDNFNDVREVLSIMDNIGQASRMLVSLGYDDADVRSALGQQFPGENVEVAIAEAHRQKAGLEADVAAAISAGDQAAIAAEHDLGRSNDPR